MSEHFDKALPDMFESAVSALLRSIVKVQDEFTKDNPNGMSNSGYPLYVQEACFEATRAYAKQLIARLEMIAHEDRVVKAEDYDSAAQSVREFAARAGEIYEQIRKQGDAFGDRRPPLNADRMRSVVESAVNDLDEYKAVFTAKRSLKKWLLADLRKLSVVSMLAALLAGVAGAYLKEWLGLH